MLDTIPSKYAFIVHTDSYAGNFERDMCAFITGQVGECGVGEEAVDEDVDYSIVEDIIAEYPDEHGCCRPVTIRPTPDQWRQVKTKSPEYNSLAILLHELPDVEQKKFMEERANLFPFECPNWAGKMRTLRVLATEWIETEHRYIEKKLEF